MRNLRALFVLLLAAVFALLPAFAPAAFADATEASGDKVEFVLVIDCSGSMLKSDREGLSIAAAQLLVDILPLENANVSVVCFGGRRYDPPYAFQNPAGAGGMLDPFMEPDGEYYNACRMDNRHVIDVCQSQPVSTVADKTNLKKKIADACNDISPDNTSVINAGMLAAVDILLSANAKADNACILLMSDGRTQGSGQGDNQQIVDALMEMNPYPVYALELNYDLQNRSDSYARDCMRTMAARYDGDMDTDRYTLVDSPASIITALSAAIGRFIDIQAVDPTLLEIVNGKSKDFSFEVADMVSEANVIVSGGVFTQLVVTDPTGKSTTYKKTDSSNPEAIYIRNGEKYAALKLCKPKIGSWNVRLFGDEDTEIYIHAISAKEMNFPLRATPSDREEWFKNDEVKITGAFEYNDEIVTSDTFYQAHPAVLTVKNATTNQILAQLEPEEVTDSGYTWRTSLMEQGIIELQATLSYEGFRSGEKNSSKLSFGVGNVPLRINDDVNLVVPETYVNSATEPIDLDQQFINADKDQVEYRLVCESDRSLSDAFALSVDDNGYAVIRMAGKAGYYNMRLEARDADMEDWLSKPFNLTLNNRPPKQTGIFHPKSMIIGVPALFGESVTHQEIDLDETFTDPDGLPLVYQLSYDQNDAVSARIEGSKLIMDATDPHSCRATLTVMDSNGDPEEAITEKFTLECQSWFGSVVRKNIKWVIIAAAVAAAAVILLRMRRVKGRWLISIEDPGNSGNNVSASFDSLASMRSFRKPQFSLRKLLGVVIDQAAADGEYVSALDLSLVKGMSPMICGTLISRKVVFQKVSPSVCGAVVQAGNWMSGADGLPTVEPKQKRLTLKPGDGVVFTYRNGDMDVLIVTIQIS